MPALVGACVLAGTAPVAAECDGPIPSFRAVVATATRVVIGEVVAVHPSELTADADDGRSTRFTLRVTEVPRGRAPRTMEIDDVQTQPCAGFVTARVGDRIAIAFDATDFEPPIPVNTAAWLRGTPPYAEVDALSAFESTTRVEIYALLGLDPPDTSVAPFTAAATAGPPWLMLAIAAAAGAAAGWRRSSEQGLVRSSGRSTGPEGT